MIFKRLFCKHNFKILYAQYLEETKEGALKQRTLWKCTKCGKISK